MNLAAALTSIQDWEGAIQAHLDALSINGNLFGVRSDLGNIFKSLGRLDEAEVCRVQSFKLSSFAPFLYLSQTFFYPNPDSVIQFVRPYTFQYAGRVFLLLQFCDVTLKKLSLYDVIDF